MGRGETPSCQADGARHDKLKFRTWDIFYSKQPCLSWGFIRADSNERPVCVDYSTFAGGNGTDHEQYGFRARR